MPLLRLIISQSHQRTALTQQNRTKISFSDNSQFFPGYNKMLLYELSNNLKDKHTNRSEIIGRPYYLIKVNKKDLE